MLNSEPSPYIGITGLTEEQQVEELVSYAEEIGIQDSDSHDLMIGFLASDEVLYNGKEAGDDRYVYRDRLPRLMRLCGDDVFPTIHYNTDNREELVPEVRYITRIANLYEEAVGAVQMNMAWPLVQAIEELDETRPDLGVILSVSQYTAGDMPVDELAATVAEEYPDVEYALIDPSWGKGEEMNVERSVETYRRMREEGFDGVIGFAGGLSGENVEDVVGRLVEETGTTDFAIDAQGNLRTGDGGKESELDMEKAKRYLDGAAAVLLDE